MKKRASWGLCVALLLMPGMVFAAYVDNGNGTVTDTVTGLIWQQGDAQNDNGGRTWENALAYCEGLSSLGGASDWRLPNVRELKSIIDYSRYNPAIDPVFNCRADYYWSGTTVAGLPSDAWVVVFDYGGDGWYDKGNSFYVRCVRGGHGSFGPFSPSVLDLLLLYE